MGCTCSYRSLYGINLWQLKILAAPPPFENITSAFFTVIINNYRPRSEAREGYVFTGVCHSVTLGGVRYQMHHGIGYMVTGGGHHSPGHYLLVRPGHHPSCSLHGHPPPSYHPTLPPSPSPLVRPGHHSPGHPSPPSGADSQIHRCESCWRQLHWWGTLFTGELTGHGPDSYPHGTLHPTWPQRILPYPHLLGPPYLFKHIHYVAHTAIGKQMVIPWL